MNLMRTKMAICGAVIGLAMATATGAFAQASGGSSSAGGTSSMTVRAGYLTCHVASGWGFVFGSSRDVKCAYALQPGYTEYYTGSITKFGADIGYLSSGVIVWAVLAPTNNLGQGALSGHYAGATASAAVGVGAGANVLIGGFKNSIALQPVSIEGQNGLNIAAGVAALALHFDSSKKPKVGGESNVNP